jgi:hypothetical protein
MVPAWLLVRALYVDRSVRRVLSGLFELVRTSTSEVARSGQPLAPQLNEGLDWIGEALQRRHTWAELSAQREELVRSLREVKPGSAGSSAGRALDLLAWQVCGLMRVNAEAEEIYAASKRAAMAAHLSQNEPIEHVGAKFEAIYGPLDEAGLGARDALLWHLSDDPTSTPEDGARAASQAAFWRLQRPAKLSEREAFFAAEQGQVAAGRSLEVLEACSEVKRRLGLARTEIEQAIMQVLMPVVAS